MQLADGIGSHRNRFVIGIHEPCVSRNATGTLWDSDLQAVCKLAGEMKLHRRANTRNPGRTAYWRICRKCCLATERSARAGSIRGWAGLLDLEDIPGSGLLWGKGKDILGTEDQHEWWLRFRPLWGLFLGQCKDQSDEGWDVHWGNMGQTIGGLNGWEEEFSGRWEALKVQEWLKLEEINFPQTLDDGSYWPQQDLSVSQRIGGSISRSISWILCAGPIQGLKVHGQTGQHHRLK